MERCEPADATAALHDGVLAVASVAGGDLDEVLCDGGLVARSFEPEFSDKDGPGVASLLERDRRTVELNDDAFAAFADDSAASTSSTATLEQQRDQQPKLQQHQQQERGHVGKQANKTNRGADLPKRAREAIDLGLLRFQEGLLEEAIDLFQLSLELPGSGVMRLEGTVREYSCPSEGEENAALYNMACAWARLGQKQSALTVVQALLENNFDDFNSLRTDPDLASLRGPDLDKLLAQHDNLATKLFGRKKQQPSSNKPWLQW